MTAPLYSTSDLPLFQHGVALGVATPLNLRTVTGKPSGYGPQELFLFPGAATTTFSVTIENAEIGQPAAVVSIVLEPGDPPFLFKGHTLSVQSDIVSRVLCRWFSTGDTPLNPTP